MIDMIEKINSKENFNEKNTDFEYDPINPYIGKYTIEQRNKADEIVNSFKKESLMSIQDKITLTREIIANVDILVNFENFYEEECQLSLVNWLSEYRKYIAFLKSKADDNKLYELLYNIIYIFQVFPVNSKDIITLKIFEKLNKIRKIMNKNLNIYQYLDYLLNYWNIQIRTIRDNEKENKMLNKKRERADNLIKDQDKDKDNKVSIKSCIEILFIAIII